MRKNRKSATKVLLASIVLTATMGLTTYAAEWKQDTTGWWHEQDGGGYATGWNWIDGKCYYFDGNGYMLSNTTTPDGFQVDESGAWTVNGVVQTQGTTNAGVNHSVGYDPAHPLAGKIDEWNLRLPTKYIGEYTIVNANVQAMLTGQMDQYYMPPVGYSTSPMGNQVYTSQEAVDRAIKEEQALYNWFCNWLNSMNFESMSDMEKAKEIQKVLGDRENVVLSGDEIGNRNGDYSILIEKNGNCTEYAIVATSLAKALGLKSAMSGTGTHAVYYIQVDGKAYFGQNNVLNLNVPTPDNVYVD